MINIRWFPPSWFQIKTKNRIIYIDPAYLKTYYTKYPKKIEFSSWPNPIDGLPEKLPKAHVILITHEHKDHVKDVTVRRIRRADALVLAPKRCSRELGKSITVIAAGDVASFKNIRITAVEEYNAEGGSSTRKIHRKGRGVGYVINVEGKTIYHAGDTDMIPEMKKLGPVDVALLPIGGTYTMNIKEAVDATITIGPRAVIPMHHLRAEPWEFKKKLERKSNVKAVILSIGGTYQVP